MRVWVGIALLILAPLAQSQTHNHDEQTLQFWHNLRQMPVKVLSIEGNEIRTVTWDKEETLYGTYHTDDNTVYSKSVIEVHPKDMENTSILLTRAAFTRDFKDKGWVIFYCSECHLIYRLHEMRR